MAGSELTLRKSQIAKLISHLLVIIDEQLARISQEFQSREMSQTLDAQVQNNYQLRTATFQHSGVLSLQAQISHFKHR